MQCVHLESWKQNWGGELTSQILTRKYKGNKAEYRENVQTNKRSHVDCGKVFFFLKKKGDNRQTHSKQKLK